jgi:hypothetical protein
MLIRQSYLATGFKTYKKSIIGANMSMFRSQSLVASGVREEKASFEVRDTSLGGCGTVSNGKKRLSEEKYCLHLQCRTFEE